MKRTFTTLLMVLAVIAAACGGDDDGSFRLEMGDTSLGQIMTTSAGDTLYLFIPDGQGPSVCYDDCASAWPPLTAEIAAGDGVDADLIGSIERTDAGTQVTYNDWPLYFYSGDAAEGDTNGQGINDVWYVVDASGNPIN